MKTKIVLCMHRVRQKVYSLRQGRLFSDRRGFGMNELLGIAAAVILAAFIVIPGLKKFTDAVMKELTDWWGKVGNDIFPTA